MGEEHKPNKLNKNNDELFEWYFDFVKLKNRPKRCQRERNTITIMSNRKYLFIYFRDWNHTIVMMNENDVFLLLFISHSISAIIIIIIDGHKWLEFEWNYISISNWNYRHECDHVCALSLTGFWPKSIWSGKQKQIINNRSNIHFQYIHKTHYKIVLYFYYNVVSFFTRCLHNSRVFFSILF